MPFITPNNLPTGTYCRQILIPNDPYWIGLVSGALLPFTYESEWEQRTGITQEQAASRWLTMLNEYWRSDCGGDNMPCEGNCPEVLRRINPETGQPEISTDGGSTWVIDPQSAVAQIVAQPPPVTAGISANKCDAASNGKQHIVDLIAGCSVQLGTAITVFDLAVAVVEIVLEIAILFISGGTASPLVIALAPAIWGAAHAAFEFGKTAFDAYWTTDETDKILCALFCTIGDDGSFTDAQYAAFLAKWKDDATPSPAFNFVYSALKPIGVKGLNNYCSYGESADADCDDCVCGDECPTIADWEAVSPGVLGTIIARDATSITIRSEYYAGYLQYVAYIQNPTAPYTDCCSVIAATHDGTPYVQAQDASSCGHNPTISFDLGTPSFPVTCNGIGFVTGASAEDVIVTFAPP